MFTKKEKATLLIENIQNKFLKKGLFKNKLSEFDLESPIKKLLDFEYTYGSDDNFDFFVLINKDLEGFIWGRTFYKENGRYLTRDIFLNTDSFKDMKSIVENNFNMENLRTELLIMFRTVDRSSIPFSLRKVLSYVMFDSKVRKPLRMKTVGLMLVLLRNDMNNYFNKRISEKLEEDFLIWKNKTNRDMDINKIVLDVILENLDYIVKNNIDITTIPVYLEENIL